MEKAWYADIKAVVTFNCGYVYKQDLFTDLYVPIQYKDNWILLIC